ncbi:MAG: glycerate kinase [Bacteroidota bacterium]
MTILIAPDKFKGSLSAAEVAAAMARACRKVFPQAHLIERPLADGGEGSLDILREVLPLKQHRLEVCGPLRRSVPANYLLGAGKAYIEVAQACGLQHVPQHRRDPGYTTTIGVGELIEDALARGANEVYLFLGGSATNDCGAGMAGALGFRFFSDRGKDFIPSGSSLRYVTRIDTATVNPRIKEVSFYGVCDVANPLLGPQGATYVYAPQKGAQLAELANLEEGMHLFSAAVEYATGQLIRDYPGAGAAGGLGAACIAFLGGTLQSGIKTMLSAVGFPELLQGADLVLTGEGKIDEQTPHGKVVSGVAAAAASLGVPTIAFGGVCTVDLTELPDLTGIHALMDQDGMTTERAMTNAAEEIEKLVAGVLKA